MNPEARENFRRQAGWCEALGSPFTARVCRVLGERLNEDSSFGARLLNWPGDAQADAVALRACGALNLLARGGHPALAPLYPPHDLPMEEELWRGIVAAIASDDLRLTAILDSSPQTNEVARSALLLPGYLAIARLAGLPLGLREIGASAGLNLLFDRYSYRYGSFSWGAADAAVTIACEWRGETPDLAVDVDVVDRLGCDLNPIDARDLAQRERMLSYVWPDQTARLARIGAALDLAASEAIGVEKEDAARFVARELAAPQPGRVTTLVHSIVWQYLPQATKTAITASIAEAASRATTDAPFAWLRLEAEADQPRGAVLRLSLWPRGLVDAPLAVADFHGRWIEWRGLA